MERTALATTGGMIFDFHGSAASGDADPQHANSVGHDRIPLDMIFASRGSVVVAIMSYEPPMSDEFITASGPVSAVIKLEAGTA